MRRLTFALAVMVVAACSSPAATPPSDGSSPTTLPNLFGQTFVAPTLDATPDASVAPADVSTWQMLAPIGLGFGVAFPGQPSVRQGRIGDPAAPTTYWTYTDPNGRAFQLARSVLPTGVLSDSPTSLFDRFDDTLFEDLKGGTFISRTDAAVDGRPGISYQAQAGSKRTAGLLILYEHTAVVNKQTVVDKAILYRVAMTYDVSRPDDASLQAFLNSFTLFA